MKPVLISEHELEIQHFFEKSVELHEENIELTYINGFAQPIGEYLTITTNRGDKFEVSNEYPTPVIEFQKKKYDKKTAVLKVKTESTELYEVPILINSVDGGYLYNDKSFANTQDLIIELQETVEGDTFNFGEYQGVIEEFSNLESFDIK